MVHPKESVMETQASGIRAGAGLGRRAGLGLLALSLACLLAVGFARAEEIAGTVELDGRSVSYDVLTGSGTLSNTSETLSVVTLTGDGDAVFDGALVGNIRLVKTGRGVQTFAKNNDGYTGGTWIEGGTLEAVTLDWIGAYGNSQKDPERMIRLRNGACVRASTSNGMIWQDAYMHQGLEVLPGETGVFEANSYAGKDGTILFTNATLVLRGQHSLKSYLLDRSVRNGCLRIDSDARLLVTTPAALGDGRLSGFKIEVGDGAEVLVAGKGDCNLQGVTLKGGSIRALPLLQTGNDAGALETLSPVGGEQPSLILRDALTVAASARPSQIVGADIRVAYGTGKGELSVSVVADGELRLNGRVAPTAGPADTSRTLVKRGAGRLVVDGHFAEVQLRAEEGEVAFAPGWTASDDVQVEVSPTAAIRLEDGADVSLRLPLLAGVLSEADVWMDAAKIEAADGASVGRLPNLGRVGGDFAAVSVEGTSVAQSSPRLRTGIFGSQPVLSFGGKQCLVLDSYTNKTESLTTFVVLMPTNHVKWSSPFSLSATTGTSGTAEEMLVGTYFYSFNGGDVSSFKAARGLVGSSSTDWAFSYSLPGYEVGQPLLLAHRRNGDWAEGTASRGEAFADCVQTNSSGWKTQGITRVLLGGRMYGNGTPYGARLFQGHVGELLVFTRVLSDAEFQSVETYLKNKWFASGKEPPDLHGDVPNYGDRVEVRVADGAVARLSPKSTYGGTAGDYVKTDGGMLVAGDFSGVGRLTAEAGTLALATDVPRPSKALIWLDPSDAATVAGTADAVQSIANKGSLGGAFVKNLGVGARLVSGVEGLNGRSALAFNGDSLLYTGFERTDGSPRSLHVYAIVCRDEYKQFTAPYSFAHADDTDNDKKANGNFHFEANVANGKPIYRMLYGKDTRGLTNGVNRTATSTESYYIDLPRRDADGETCLSVCRMGADWQLSAMERASDDVTAVPWYGTARCQLSPLRVNRVQLGGSMKRGGAAFGEGGSWHGRLGEFIVFDEALTVEEETALLAYLRKKWLGKGEGTDVPPDCLGGRFATTLGTDLALRVVSPAQLVHTLAPQPLYALALEGASLVRQSPTADVADFALFDVTRDLHLAGTIALGAAAFPSAATVPLVTYGGTATDTATWSLPEAFRTAYRVKHREKSKSVCLLSGYGTLLIVR